MADYATRPARYDVLLDREIREFVKRTTSFYPEDAVATTITEQRRMYDDMCAAFYAGRPGVVDVRDVVVPPAPASDSSAQHGTAIALREYVHSGAEHNTAAMVLYLHGGGFVVGGLDSHDDVCAELCQTTGFTVFSCDYRLAPEHLHPAAFDDALSAYRWIKTKFETDVVIVGDSAGANLSAAVCASLRAMVSRPVGQVLIYPYLGSSLDSGSAVFHANAPLLTRDDLKFYHGIRLDPADQLNARDWRYAPLLASGFSELPATVAFSAECDPLADDARLYVDQLTAAGTPAHWVEGKGLVHGYLRARHMSSRARDAFSHIVQATKSLGMGKWPI